MAADPALPHLEGGSALVSDSTTGRTSWHRAAGRAAVVGGCYGSREGGSNRRTIWQQWHRAARRAAAISGCHCSSAPQGGWRRSADVTEAGAASCHLEGGGESVSNTTAGSTSCHGATWRVAVSWSLIRQQIVVHCCIAPQGAAAVGGFGRHGSGCCLASLGGRR